MHHITMLHITPPRPPTKFVDFFIYIYIYIYMISSTFTI